MKQQKQRNDRHLNKVCKTLNADFGNIMEYVPDAEIWDLYNENRVLFGKDHVSEDSLQGAIREAKEEVGVDLIPEKGQVLFTKVRKITEGKIFNDIMHAWLVEHDGEVDLSNATKDEVAQVAQMNREKIKELFEQKMFVETLEYFFAEVDKKVEDSENR